MSVRLGEPFQVVGDRTRFFQNIFFCPASGENVPKVGQKKSFEKIGDYFFLNLVNNESVYYFLSYCTKPIPRENLVPEIWPKCSWSIRLQDF